MDPNQYYNDPSLGEAQQKSQEAATTANQYASAASLLPQKLKDAINEKIDYDSGIVNEKNKAAAAYFQAPAQARVDYQNIWNPFQRENLVTQARTNAYIPYQNYQDILAQRKGSLADIINAGTGAFHADVTAKQGAADIARQNWQDLLGLAGAKSDLAYKYAALAKSGGGGLAGQQLSETKKALAKDVAAGVPFYELYPRYKDLLSEYEIRNAYNAGPLAAKEGSAAKESSASLQQTAAQQQREQVVAEYATAVQNGQMTIDEVPAAYKGEVANVTGKQTTESKPWWQLW